MNWAIWAIFAAELAFILTVAPKKAAALRAHWLDAGTVVVTIPAFGRLLSSLRLVRLARLLRLSHPGTRPRLQIGSSRATQWSFRSTRRLLWRRMSVFRANGG